MTGYAPATTVLNMIPGTGDFPFVRRPREEPR